MSIIPIEAAEAVAKEHGQKQVIIFGWDGKRTHVATYGKSVEDCAQAAAGANAIKRNWGWPESTLVEPSRVKKLQKQIADLEEEIAQLKRGITNYKASEGDLS